MRKEAFKEGYWTSAGGNAYPKLQILTVGGLLAHAESARIPPQDKRSVLGYKAKRQAQSGGQAELFGTTNPVPFRVRFIGCFYRRAAWAERPCPSERWEWALEGGLEEAAADSLSTAAARRTDQSGVPRQRDWIRSSSRLLLLFRRRYRTNIRSWLNRRRGEHWRTRGCEPLVLIARRQPRAARFVGMRRLFHRMYPLHYQFELQCPMILFRFIGHRRLRGRPVSLVL